MIKKNLFSISLFLLFGFTLSFTSTTAQDERTVDSVYRIAWNPVENRIAFANFSSLYVWDFVNNKLILKQELDDKSPLSGLRWSPDGIRLAANSYADKTLKVWDVGADKLILTIRETTPSYGLDWTPDGKQILTGSSGLDNVSEISRWDATSGKLLAHYDRGAEAIFRSPDNRMLATLSDVQILLRDAITLETQVKLDKDINVDEGLLASIAAWSPDGQLLAGGYQATCS
jgi:WD40 repeat protein